VCHVPERRCGRRWAVPAKGPYNRKQKTTNYKNNITNQKTVTVIGD